MRRAIVLRRFILLFLVVTVGLCARAQVRRDMQMPISVCLQYQRARQQRGTGVAPFRQYGFRRLLPPENAKADGKQLWGYQVRLDSVPTAADGSPSTNSSVPKGKVPLYRYFHRVNIYSFGVIDSADSLGTCQYVFWAKAYYRRFANSLKQFGFAMSQDRRRPNVLRFTRDDIGIYVDFIIWEDVYVMEIGSKKKA